MTEGDYVRRWRGVRFFVAACIYFCGLVVLYKTGSVWWAAVVFVGLVAVRLIPICAQLDAIEAKQDIEANQPKKQTQHNVSG